MLIVSNCWWGGGSIWGSVLDRQIGAQSLRARGQTTDGDGRQRGGGVPLGVHSGPSNRNEIPLVKYDKQVVTGSSGGKPFWRSIGVQSGLTLDAILKYDPSDLRTQSGLNLGAIFCTPIPPDPLLSV